MTRHKIPTSTSFSLYEALADDLQVQTWRSFGLRTDAFSTDNAIMATHCHNWPLMIDPQEQALDWITRMESANGLEVVKVRIPRGCGCRNLCLTLC